MIRATTKDGSKIQRMPAAIPRKISNLWLSKQPYVVALLVWLFAFSSLALVAVRTNTVGTGLFMNPAILLGDFTLLPAIAFLITRSSRSTKMWDAVLPSSKWSVGTATLTLLLTVISGIYFGLVNSWWMFHGLFYWLMAYMIGSFLLRGLLLFLRGVIEPRLVLTSCLVCVFVLLHQYLGIAFPKVFPMR